MATTAIRSISVNYTGDVGGSEILQPAVQNIAAAGPQPVVLASGDNVITVPTGFTVDAVSIRKPAGNTVLIKLKQVGGDTGVQLGLTSPDSISLNAGTVSFILNAAAPVTVELYWS